MPDAAVPSARRAAATGVPPRQAAPPVMSPVGERQGTGRCSLPAFRSFPPETAALRVSGTSLTSRSTTITASNAIGCGPSPVDLHQTGDRVRSAGKQGGRLDRPATPGRRDKPRKQPRSAEHDRSAQSASVVLPEPDAPAIRTPRSPSTTAVAWRLRSCTGYSLGRKRHYEARAADLARLAARDVLGRQRAAMRLDDLPADRQAEAGILAERLAGRPVGIEALEDAVDVVGADARAVVVDGNDDRTCRRATG